MNKSLYTLCIRFQLLFIFHWYLLDILLSDPSHELRTLPIFLSFVKFDGHQQRGSSLTIPRPLRKCLCQLRICVCIFGSNHTLLEASILSLKEIYVTKQKNCIFKRLYTADRRTYSKQVLRKRPKITELALKWRNERYQLLTPKHTARYWSFYNYSSSFPMSKLKGKLRGLNPGPKHTDLVTSACRWS
jgi:hypothetical protein